MYSNILNNWFYGEDVQVDDMKLLTKSFLQLCFAANGGNVMATGITPTITGNNIATTKGFVYFGETSDAIFIERTGTNQLLSFVDPTSVPLIANGYLYVKPIITYDVNNRTSTVSGVVYTSTNAADEGINLATITNSVITQVNSINPLGATQLQRGIIQLATQAEVNTGTISNKAVVPSTLAQLLTLYAKLSANNAFTGINTVPTQLVTDTTTKIANMAAINNAFNNFTQFGAGAVTQSYLTKVREIVSVKDFGAVGDGVTDDTSAIQAAINYAGSIRATLLVNSGTYKISLPLTSLSSININCEHKVVFDGTTIPPYAVGNTYRSLLSVTGSISDPSLLTTDAIRGTYIISVASTVGYSVGDLILVSSNQYYSGGGFVMTSSGSTVIANYCGVTCRVAKVISGTQLSIDTPCPESYLITDGAYVKKITPVTFSMTGGKLILAGVNSGQIGISLTYVENSIVENVAVIAAENIGVSVSYSDNVTVSNCNIQRCTSPYLANPLLTQTGYGVLFGSGTVNSTAFNNYFELCRHSVSGGGAHPARSIILDGNQSFNCGLGAADIDNHEPCEYWTITNCTSVGGPDGSGGIVSRGLIGVNITNNTLVNCGTGIMAKHFYVNSYGLRNYIISGNIMRNCTTGILLGVEYSNIYNTVVSNNIMALCGTGIYCGRENNRLSLSNTLDSIVISNNVISGNTSTAVFGEYLSTSSINCNNIAPVSARSVSVIYSDNVAIDDNIITGPNTAVLAMSSNFISVSNNTFNHIGAATAPTIDFPSSTPSTNVNICGNTLKGSVGNFAYLSGSNYVVSNNTTQVTAAAGGFDVFRGIDLSKAVFSGNVAYGQYRYGIFVSGIQNYLVVVNNILTDATSEKVSITAVINTNTGNI